MSNLRQVVVSYPVDDEFASINSEVLAGEAEVTFLGRLSASRRERALATADVLIGWNLGRELPAGVLSGRPRIEFVQLLSAGVDGADFTAIGEDVVVAGNVGAYAAPIAEHVMAMTLALAHRLPQRHAALAAGDFNQWEPLLTLAGSRCAVLGFGGIGRATATLMRPFGARIHAVTRAGRALDPADDASPLADLDWVLASSDVVVICLPLTVATRGLIGARELALMKPTAILVNVARADIVDEAALYEHLCDHPDFSAGIDVWWDEPVSGVPFTVAHPFFSLPNVIGSPHNSGLVAGVLQSAARAAADNARRYLRGERVTGVVRREEYLGLG